MPMDFFGDMPPKPVNTSLTLEWTPTAPGPSRERREPARDSLLALLRTWFRRRRSRILLSQLDDRLLKDVGPSLGGFF
jgi:uncharacterized protein YjiS (DUF1127 family)